MGPRRIICLTEESTEWLYLLGEEDRIVGISGYTVRPRQARLEKPRVSSFLDGKQDKILALKPDLVIGFSDMQASLAERLIRDGLNVWITNQRSLEEIFQTLAMLASLVGAQDRASRWIDTCRENHESIREQASAAGPSLRGYFEEWDEPMISAIRWVSELMAIAGAKDVFEEKSHQSLGKDRIIHEPDAVVEANPQIIFGSWCGKKFRPERLRARAGWQAVDAVRHQQLFEIKSSEILQPGPAALTDGLWRMHERIRTAKMYYQTL